TNPSGGTSGSANGGRGSEPKGGSAGSPGGGATQSGGAMGNPSGGSVAMNGGSGGAVGGSVNPGGGVQGTAGQGPSGPLLVVSSPNGRWKTDGMLTDGAGMPDVTVNDASPAQNWEGFGGAFNELGWSYLTTQALQDQAIQLLFGNDGCRFAWG